MKIGLFKNLFSRKRFTTFSSHQHGFTLIELLVVITIIATLAVAVFVALNPAGRLRDARDARRASDVPSILTAIHQAVVDNGGNYPTNLPAVGVEAQLGTGTAAQCSPLATGGCNVLAAQACVDLMANLAIDLIPYLKSMPIDPTTTTFSSINTGYTVMRDTNGIITVRACGTQGVNPIFSSR